MFFRQDLQRQRIMLEEEYNTLAEKEASLRRARTYETDPAIAFKLDHQIKEAAEQRGNKARQIQAIEHQINNPPQGVRNTINSPQANPRPPVSNPRSSVKRKSNWKRNAAIISIIVLVLVGGFGSYTIYNKFFGPDSNEPTSFPLSFVCTACVYSGLNVALDMPTFDSANSKTSLKFTISNTGSQGCSNISFNTLQLQDIEGTQYSPQQPSTFSVASGQTIPDSEVITNFIPVSGTPYMLNLAISVYNCSLSGTNTYQTESVVFQTSVPASQNKMQRLDKNQAFICTTCNYQGLGGALDSTIVDPGNNKTILKFTINDKGVNACSNISFDNLQLQDNAGNKYSPSQNNTFSVAAGNSIDDYEVINNFTPPSGTQYSLNLQISVYNCTLSGTNTYQSMTVTF